jgi:hypothetical protein
VFPEYLLISILKIEIKCKINIDKIIFYILDALNVQVPKQNFHIYMFNYKTNLLSHIKL